MQPNNSPPDALIIPGVRSVPITAAASDFAPCRAFHANVSETLTLRFVEDAADRDIVVNAGTMYPYAIKRVSVGTGVIAIY